MVGMAVETMVISMAAMAMLSIRATTTSGRFDCDGAGTRGAGS